MGPSALGYRVPRVLLPRDGTDLSRWAVIACDQFTSEPEYWQEVERLVGDAPSTYNLVLPEVYLGTASEAARVAKVQASMRDYLARGLFIEREGLIYVERAVGGRVRKGLLVAVDLEHYDFRAGAASLIRASEGTIVDRLPPRMRIREGAPLEVPHILLLIDDPEGTVIEPIASRTRDLEKLYDFELMLGGGHVSGFFASEASGVPGRVAAALSRMAEPSAFARKYDVPANAPPMLFAAGDGNHSLATAKAIWERKKAEVGPNHPARYALVEVENVHDQGLVFEPIHRVLFELGAGAVDALRSACDGDLTYVRCEDTSTMVEVIEGTHDGRQRVGLVTPGGFGIATFEKPSSELAVGTLDKALEVLRSAGRLPKIDYVHGAEIVTRLGQEARNAGVYLPSMAKSDLFRTVLHDGVLPRKTFSMGHAREKRYYLECREIR